VNVSALVQVVAVAMALILALRALRARNMASATLVRWCVIWVALIALLALLISHLT
jgi:hypothetical protein